LEAVWTLADITNALMTFPNLIALLGLRRDVIEETRQFFQRKDTLNTSAITEEAVQTVYTCK